ncbi:hypothetical protein ABS71_20120 [bacterium SCN 62-11]|nr:hypothetical protein [Candidatus Eremiobacteraeota bacterium]ODT57339.1 MAG: hypothetical protein ABS71_20120 [bacterium SCN 62-11]
MATTLLSKETCTAHGPELRQLLLAQIGHRTGNLPFQPTLETDLREVRRRKVITIVEALFAEEEWAGVLRSLDRSVALLDASNIEPLLLEVASDQTACQVANLYLRSRGFHTSGGESTGCSDHERCYLTSEYFWHNNPFADFLVYDCARTICDQALLSIASERRELFARACEAYSRVLELATRKAARLQLVEEMNSDGMFGPVAELVGEAVRARNGWKVLLRASVR